MKALILSLENGKAIVLLRGGEMRTIRARREWSVGQEIDLHQAAWHLFDGSAAHVFVPLAACAAVLALLFAGIYHLGGENIDQTLHPLSSGSMTAENTPQETPEPMQTELSGAVVMETQTIEPTETAALTAAPSMPVQPMHVSHHQEDNANEYCDECGQRGHDDDECPNQICEECGQRGHDDDECPNQICEECGQRGHDDDECPNQICEECGQRGHDDDECPNQICEECGQRGHDDDDCPNEADDDDDDD